MRDDHGEPAGGGASVVGLLWASRGQGSPVAVRRVSRVAISHQLTNDERRRDELVDHVCDAWSIEPDRRAQAHQALSHLCVEHHSCLSAFRHREWGLSIYCVASLSLPEHPHGTSTQQTGQLAFLTQCATP